MDQSVHKLQQQTRGSAPTEEEVINSIKAVSNTNDFKEFVHVMKRVLEDVKSNKSESAKVKEGSTNEKEKAGMWTSFITCGAKFLDFVKAHIENLVNKKDIFSKLRTIIEDVAVKLGKIGEFQWVAAAVACAAVCIESYMTKEVEEVSFNKDEVLDLLTNMVDLATIVIQLGDVIPEEKEKLKNAVVLIVQGSMMCLSQIYSTNILSLDTSVSVENLQRISKTLNHFYNDLNLTITTAIAKRQPKLLPLRKPLFPNAAVGIETAREEVIKMLYGTPKYELPGVVVIYGLGGVGKTTLATSVIATLNLESYNYARVLLEGDKMSKNKLKKMQEILLRDAFPTFHLGNAIKLRDCEEGRERLKEAFQCIENKPVFLFVDNLLRSEDVKELLPEDLTNLPKGSRILVTTRMLAATNIFEIDGLTRYFFAVKTLKKDHAIQILCKDVDNGKPIKDDMEKILQICGGVPLALRMVNGVFKRAFNASACSLILDALQRGDYVKTENLTERVIDFVYNELEDATRDAFLDICCFFNGWIRRHVEYVVGVEEVKSLEEAALVTAFVGDVGKGVEAVGGVLQRFSPIYDGEERLIVYNIVRARGLRISAATRFTDVESFYEAAQDERKLNGIKGVWFDPKEKYVLDVKHLNLMKHSLRIMSLGKNMRTSAQSVIKFKELRYLEVVDDDVPHLPMKLKELDMLRMYIGPSNSISTNKLPKSLSMMLSFPSKLSMMSRFMQGVQNHSLKELSKCLSMIRRFIVERLKMWGAIVQQFPSLGESNSLEELLLWEVKDIQGLHKLNSLKILFIPLYEEKTEEFLEQIGKLSSLTKLFITGSSGKSLPKSFGRLKRTGSHATLELHGIATTAYEFR